MLFLKNDPLNLKAIFLTNNNKEWGQNNLPIFRRGVLTSVCVTASQTEVRTPESGSYFVPVPKLYSVDGKFRSAKIKCNDFLHQVPPGGWLIHGAAKNRFA